MTGSPPASSDQPNFRFNPKYALLVAAAASVAIPLGAFHGYGMYYEAKYLPANAADLVDCGCGNQQTSLMAPCEGGESTSHAISTALDAMAISHADRELRMTQCVFDEGRNGSGTLDEARKACRAKLPTQVDEAVEE